MNIFTIFAIIAFLTILVGVLIAVGFVALSSLVVSNEAAMESGEKLRSSMNPKNTRGHKIATAKKFEEKVLDARQLAARQAASMPRGANMGIGRLDTTDAREDKKHSSLGVNDDPITAVKIAEHHTWNGLEYQSPDSAMATTTTSAGPVKRKLVPGKDYDATPLVGLTGAAKRAAGIANAKAKAAAYQKLKDSGQEFVSGADAAAAVAAATSSAAPAAAAPVASAVPAGVDLPPAPDYIEITDGMDPADLRKARLSNSKMKSAYNKQLKAMGIDPKSLAAPKAAAPAPVAAAASAVPAGVDLPPKPDLVEITDDMAPEDKRSAKLTNAKALSAYKKQLKAMGIDPKTVKF